MPAAIQATAATEGESATIQAKTRQASERPLSTASLEVRLERKRDAAEKYRSVVRFFSNHRWLLSSSQHAENAGHSLRRATARLRRVTRQIAELRAILARREAWRRAQAPPKAAICDVFGRRYCSQALTVAWCESRHSTSARNGQFLGLFQMGWSERRLFGHGSTAFQQARAAHRYFVVSGRDWSPWSCKPWYGYS